MLLSGVKWCQVSVDRNRDVESSLPKVIGWAWVETTGMAFSVKWDHIGIKAILVDKESESMILPPPPFPSWTDWLFM